MPELQALLAPLDGLVESREFAPRNGFHLEPRCHVCRNDEMRTKVNDMLAAGASYAFIVRALGEHNANCDKRDRVSIDSVRNHCTRHFPVQQVARATFREILERRAKENGVDFVEGVATAITPMALYETIMVRGYQNLVDPDTKIDVNTAMIGGWSASVSDRFPRGATRHRRHAGPDEPNYLCDQIHSARVDVAGDRAQDEG